MDAHARIRNARRHANVRCPTDRLETLATQPAGLTRIEAAARLARFGPNQILEPEAAGWRAVLRDSARDPMPWFLLATSLVFALAGEAAEAIVLLVALVPLFGMDAWLHRRTQASRAGLSQQLAERARVRRDDIVMEVPATDLVPGDVLTLVTGETVPADALVTMADGLQVDESALTGESFPVRKSARPGQPPYRPSLDDTHWLRAGTRVLTGSAEAIVVWTGATTLYGEIVRSAMRGSHELTPLQRAVAQLVKVLLLAAVALCAVLAWIRMLQGHGVLDALLSAVTLAVAAIPEEFPVVLAVFLGVGIFRLAKRQALVRRAVVVENIGRVSCICTDKTGTLTEGRLTLAHVRTNGAADDTTILGIAAMAARPDTGDPLDVAILDQAAPQPAPPLATFPFTEDRKRETAIHRIGTRLVAATKGAPELVLALCDLDGPARQRWTDETATLAAGGHKVIAVASREIDADTWAGGEPDRGFRLCGLLAFEDPVRDGVREALDYCREAGIRVIMVTGDHPGTARAIAADIGLGGDRPGIVTGAEVDTFLDAGDAARLQTVDVVARATPAQKLRVVRALQARGELVAVTGDGVNDVPALQSADIGIAMGRRGTRSAREAASIVLLDDNFRSIVHAIAEGRQLFGNLRLSFAYLLMIHIPLVITAAAIPLAGFPLLYLPIHIVWLELLIHPTALLVFQSNRPARATLASARPRETRFFDRTEWLMVVSTGTAITLMVYWSYLRSLGAGYEVEHARAMALVTLIVANAGVTAALSRLQDRVAVAMVIASLALTVLLVQAPWITGALHLQPLHGDDWIIALAGGLAVGTLPWVVRGLRRALHARESAM